MLDTPETDCLPRILAELQAETCDYFRNGWRRFYNTMETLVQEAEAGSRVLDLGGDVSDWPTRPKERRHPYSFGRYFRMAGFDYASLNWNDLDLRSDPLPFEDGSFDVVTNWETIEHLWAFGDGGMLSWEGIVHSWREAHRVLKPGGLFFVATRNRFCPLIFQRLRTGMFPQCYVTGFIDGELRGGHIREFTGAELDALAQVTGTYPQRRLLCRSSLEPELEEKLVQVRVDIEAFLRRELAADEVADSIYLLGRKAA